MNIHEIQSEDLIEQAFVAGSPLQGMDPELAGDLALKTELAALRLPAVPGLVSRRILTATRWRRRSPWLMAAAAVLAAVLVAPGLFRPDAPPEADAADLGELQFALDTISRTTRDALALAGTQLIRQMSSGQPGTEPSPPRIDSHTDSQRRNTHENS